MQFNTYINLGYGAQALKIVIFRNFVLFLSFL
jgi:hypothetical protein